MTITLCPITVADQEKVGHLAVATDQEEFVGTIPFIFSMNRAGEDYYAMMDGDQAVGFFLLDRAYPAHYDFAHAGEIGLRGVLVGLQYQGKGYASAMLKALPDLVRATYPDCPGLILTVNLRNPGALQAYLRYGFHDTGEQFLHGGAGPQNILRQSIV